MTILNDIDRTHRRFLIEAGTLLHLLRIGGYSLYVTDQVKPDAPVPGVPDPALFYYYAPAPQDAHSHRIASIETLWRYIAALEQGFTPSDAPLDLPALGVLPPESHLVCAFPYDAMDADTREFIWPGWPQWPDKAESEMQP